ncbi:type I-E CRISPR-associated protein Cas5/CasD [Azotobacter chroococcum]|uniref:CRISPR-associated protein Cas5/CasD, subtype I-E/ECOLI n=1 Tax=Azotobacter chroococcum NCIMB 8003 TaxID=1328314 RepID=A0A0C4WIN5_9GAMM|nr:type I-E CRISPR-associated protein Cas5/CasD [Azotobacter chroococcum]AJE19594.1 CRISPR-associated protein Cas5/CasD, subtype I-E/ECOLI [Azotobacter chroococcum NCIMB 8003]
MTEPYLLLWLEGPLQAWGHDSRFGRRDSLDFPTKSGVLGLLCCALGAGGEQRELLAELADLDMQLEAHVPTGRDGNPQPRQPLLRDFHMVGSGYDDQDPWQSLLIPKTSDGKKAVGGGTKMTYRYYLQDMAFAVALQVPAARLEMFVAALREPVWDLYLGRKSCVPTEFVYQGHYATAQAALAAGAVLAGDKRRAFAFRVLQGEHEGDEVLTLNDVPLQFGEHKQYRDRRVTLQHGTT